MKPIKLLAPLALLLLLSTTQPARADLRVVTTVPDLAALAKEVGGNTVSVTALSLSTQDPHYVDAKPSLALKLNKADMLIAIGMDLEIGWLPTLQVGARNSKVQVGGDGFVDCSAFARKLGVPTVKVDRSSGDVHPQGNPHYLYDPRQAKKCAQGIATRMAQLDSKNADLYKKNYASFASRLDAAEAKWSKALSRYRGTKVFTYHQSCDYLADWLGLVVDGQLEPKPGVPPSPGHIVKLISKGKTDKVKYILQESYFTSKTATVLSKQLSAKVLSFAGGTSFESKQSYLERMQALVTQLAETLSK